MDAFRKVYVNINTDCNYRCLNCILGAEQRIKTNNPPLTAHELTLATEQLCAKIQDGVKNIWEVSGGEPTIHPEFDAIINQIGAMRTVGTAYKQVLLTNCHTLASREMASKLQPHIDDVVTAVYTADAKEHDRLTGLCDSLHNKLNAIDNLLNLGINVHVKTLVMKPSYDALPKIARLIGERFGDKIHFTINTTHFIGDANAHHVELAIPLTKSAPFVEEAIETAMHYGSSIGLFFPLCFIDPVFWRHACIDYAAQVKRTFAITPVSKRFLKARDLEEEFVLKHPTCNICPLRNRCSWPWQSYTKIFGDSEIIDRHASLFQMKGGEEP